MQTDFIQTDLAEGDDPAAGLRRRLLRATIRSLIAGRLAPHEARARLAIGDRHELIDALILECITPTAIGGKLQAVASVH